MAELRHVARLARIIDKANDDLNKDFPPGMPDKMAYSHSTLVRTIDALDIFQKRRFLPDLSTKKTNSIFRNAKAEGYIKEEVFELNPTTMGVELLNCLRVTDDKGHNLVRKRLGLFRTGYWKAVLYDNRHVISLLAIIGGLVVAISTVISLYLNYRTGIQ